MTSAVGNGLSTFGFQPFIGGPEILPDGFRTDADASPIACIGVTDTTMRVVYEPTPMVEAARQSYFKWDAGVGVSGADAAVVRLGSTADAESAFGDFAKRWQACDGKTVIKQLRGANDSELVAEISDVAVEGQIVSATVHTREGPTRRRRPISGCSARAGTPWSRLRSDSRLRVSATPIRTPRPRLSR